MKHALPVGLISVAFSLAPLAVAAQAPAVAAQAPAVAAQAPAVAAQAPAQAPAQASTKAPAKAPVASSCLVAQFKTLALGVSDQAQRTRQAEDWLVRNIARCTPEQLSAIKSNSAAWLGTALTPALWGLIEGAIEARISGNPALMGQLYESLGKEGNASVVTYQTPTPRAPVVRPMQISGGLAGSVNYGNISGPSTSILNQNTGQGSNQSSNQNLNAVQSPNVVQSMSGGANNSQIQNQFQSGLPPAQ